MRGNHVPVQTVRYVFYDSYFYGQPYGTIPCGMVITAVRYGLYFWLHWFLDVLHKLLSEWNELNSRYPHPSPARSFFSSFAASNFLIQSGDGSAKPHTIYDLIDCLAGWNNTLRRYRRKQLTTLRPLRIRRRSNSEPTCDANWWCARYIIEHYSL